ncbi:hypothetical protein [Komagataeibacter xylinus]|uniref:hypothetical protein n=1 Tax=Komagataeibacter xylinus TaxID=28448 RepID=UPI00280A5EB2|nr:hypothetical protein [Komagataeibacter xylinus]
MLISEKYRLFSLRQGRDNRNSQQDKNNHGGLLPIKPVPEVEPDRKKDEGRDTACCHDGHWGHSGKTQNLFVRRGCHGT